MPNASSLCVFCMAYPETCNHLFLHCQFSRAVWFGNVLGFQVPSPTDVSVESWILNLWKHKKVQLLLGFKPCEIAVSIMVAVEASL